MSNITGNEPAMPAIITEEYPGNIGEYVVNMPGLTIRQELAARAMQGILAGINSYETLGRYMVNGGYLSYELVAIDAVGMADAMINQFNKS